MAVTRIVASVASIVVATLALTFALSATPAMAQNSGWWGCPDGYDFEVDAAESQMRCIKRDEVRFRAVSCPDLGQPSSGAARIVQDRNGRSDACVVGTSPYTAAPVCPRGYTAETRIGLDRCVIRIPSVIRPPIQK